MCCKNFWTKTVPFALALVLGLSTVGILQKGMTVSKNQANLNPENRIISSETGSGHSGADTGKAFDTRVEDKSSTVSEAKPVRIISKPRPEYTEAARQNQVQGTVTLRVTFTANGEIGSVSTISDLPDGLTEQAISAARRIKFEPAEKNGVPQTVAKQVQYSFTIY